MMHAPNPPSRPQWTGKQSLLTAVILPPKFEKAKFINTGITPKSNKNSEIIEEKRSKTTQLDRR